MFYLQVGQTPLHRAAAVGSLDVVQYLVSSGADVNMKDIVSGVMYNFSTKHSFSGIQGQPFGFFFCEGEGRGVRLSTQGKDKKSSLINYYQTHGLSIFLNGKKKILR